MSTCNSAGYFVAVHAGAGWHACSKEAGYELAMRQAVEAGTQALAAGASALDAVVAAISLLEDCPLTNAGYGSNLTRGGGEGAPGAATHGRVECDASVMADAASGGAALFGAVGAASGITHPIHAAARLAVCSQQPLPCGLVPPIFLAGEGAWAWARRQGLATAPTWEAAQGHLVSPAAVASWRRYNAMLQRAQAGAEAAAAPPLPPALEGASPSAAAATQCVQGGAQPAAVRFAEVADTVGALVVDDAGRVAAGVSSGGLAMKLEGRVGEAALLGSGCWAASPSAARPGVVASVSGVGEAIMRADLARAAGAALQRPDAAPVDATAAQLLHDTVLAGAPPWDAGVLLARIKVEGALQQPATGDDSEERSGSCEAREETALGERLPNAQLREAGGTGAAPVGATTAVRVEFCAAHTAGSFAVAYQSAGMAAPRSLVLRQPPPGSTPLLHTQAAGSKRPRDGGGAAGSTPAVVRGELRLPSVGLYGCSASWTMQAAATEAGGAAPL